MTIHIIGGCQNGTMGNHDIPGFLSLGFRRNLATFLHGLSLVELKEMLWAQK
jgi:hypothetical protein